MQPMLNANSEDRKRGSNTIGIPRVGRDFSRIPIHASVPTTDQTPGTGSAARKGRGKPIVSLASSVLHSLMKGRG